MLSDSITLEVSGGFANLSETVVADPDGTATRTRGRSTETRTLAPEVLTRLVELAEVLDRVDGNREYLGEGADRRTFTLTYRGATIVGAEGAIPPDVAELVALLESAVR
ncbi:MAG: hypothetical protein KDC36_01185 [Thermoleophilia bacterium]|nr:hypothetical protein [Thermoleophilia bacterium]